MSKTKELKKRSGAKRESLRQFGKPSSVRAALLSRSHDGGGTAFHSWFVAVGPQGPQGQPTSGM